MSAGAVLAVLLARAEPSGAWRPPEGTPRHAGAFDEATLARVAAQPVPEIPVAAQRDARPLTPDGWYVLDGFEEADWPDPSLWTVLRSAPPTWWPSTCHAFHGTHGLWAFGGPTSRGEVPCVAPVPAAQSSSILLNLDLTGATQTSRLDLMFELWLGFPPNTASGVFVSLLVPQPAGGRERVTVFGATGTSGTWAIPSRRLDLMALASVTDPDRVYDLRGGRWTLELLALAPNGANAGAGASIDDLTLVWEPDPAVPTLTPRPPATVALTATPTPTRVPSPTPTPPRPAFLPAVYARYVLYPSPTPTEPTATPSPEVSPSPPPPTPNARP